MSEELESQGWVRIGVAGALAREASREAPVFLAHLGKVLHASFPGETRLIERGFLRKEFSGVEVTLGADRWTLKVEAGRLNAKKTKIVRGIALKTEEISIEECLADLAEALERNAQADHRARTALAGMLNLEP